MADARVEEIADILRDAAETHHAVYAITGGADDDWATWYSDWLVNLSELPEVLAVTLVRSELTHMLVVCDRDFADDDPGAPWETYYAERILAHFAG